MLYIAENLKSLPHARESRESILAEIQREPAAGEINAYLRYILIGEPA